MLEEVGEVAEGKGLHLLTLDDGCVKSCADTGLQLSIPSLAGMRLLGPA